VSEAFPGSADTDVRVGSEAAPQPEPMPPASSPATGPADAGTGHPLVDQVLASLDTLEHQPVADHVRVFEAAHLRLREALADPDPDPHPGAG
jgi:hypothetical protein